MNTETATIVSGVVLVAVFLFVGWRARRRKGSAPRTGDHGSDSR